MHRQKQKKWQILFIMCFLIMIGTFLTNSFSGLTGSYTFIDGESELEAPSEASNEEISDLWLALIAFVVILLVSIIIILKKR